MFILEALLTCTAGQPCASQAKGQFGSRQRRFAHAHGFRRFPYRALRRARARYSLNSEPTCTSNTLNTKMAFWEKGIYVFTLATDSEDSSRMHTISFFPSSPKLFVRFLVLSCHPSGKEQNCQPVPYQSGQARAKKTPKWVHVQWNWCTSMK